MPRQKRRAAHPGTPEGRQLAQQLRPTASTTAAFKAPGAKGRIAPKQDRSRDSSGAARARMAVLVLQNRDAAPRVPAQIALDPSDENAIVVGRSRKEADVCLDLPAPAPPCLISRRHARLRRDGASWFVADLGSLNGVAVNDARIHQERKLVEGDVVRFGGAGGEELGGECATYVFSAKRRSSLLKTPAPKKRRVEPPTNHALDASNAACSAALAASDKASDAHTASQTAFTALQEHGEGARKVRRTALKALTCVPCGKPLACAVSLPCGHAIDEQCLLQKCFSVNSDPTTCACCGEQFPAFASALRRSAHVDAAVDALVLGDPALLAAHERRLDAAAAARRDAARRLDALPDPSLRPLVESLVLERTPSQADLAVGASSLLAPGRLLQAVADSYEEDVCDGCGERGHVQEDCPHRSEIDEDED